MGQVLRLWVLFMLSLGWAALAQAQESPAAITRGMANVMLQNALIAEQRGTGAYSDFADSVLAFNETRMAELTAQAAQTGQAAQIRRDARARAERIYNARSSTDYLAMFPTPLQVRADIIARHGGLRANGIELAAKQAGRMLMLVHVLSHMQSSYIDENTWPLGVRRQVMLYKIHYWDIRDDSQPRPGARPDGCNWFTRMFSRCGARLFAYEVGQYRDGEAAAREAAEWYFPPDFRERFVDLTGPGGSRAEDRQEKADREAAREARLGIGQWFLELLAVGAVLGVIALVFWSLIRSKKHEDQVSGNYGTADYASPLDREFDSGLFKGVFLGAAAHPGIPKSIFGPVVSASESHTLIVAPSGTGKGTSVILPTLLLYRSSLITIDPKGENAAITARFRRDQLGHAVHIVNPWGLHEALYSERGFSRATFNPLDVLDPKDPNIVGIANSIAVSICQHGSVNDPFWQNSATAMLAGILLWVADTPGETKTLAHVADIVSGGEAAADLRKSLFPRMVASSSFRGAMRKLVGRFVQMDDKTYSGVIAQLSQSLQFMADDQIAAATDHSSFTLADLANGKTTLYIVIPDNQMQAQAVWLKLMVDTVMQTFKRERPFAKGIRGMFLIDEFPVLGRLDGMVKDIAVVRGAGLDMTLVVQGLDQLTALYGPSSGTILSNCGFKWFCNVSDLQTAEYVSKALGQMTVRTVSQTISANDGSTNRTLGETGRALIFPDEIMSLGKQAAFVFRPGGRAYYLRLVHYKNLYGYVAPRITANAAPHLPDLKAYDPNPFYEQADQRQHEGGGSGASGNGNKDSSQAPPEGMDRAEALAMLGLTDGASVEQIREAYKSLIGKLHPDRGGTNRLAQLLNEARDILLGKKP